VNTTEAFAVDWIGNGNCIPSDNKGEGMLQEIDDDMSSDKIGGGKYWDI
jgi:hypothetical protein